jgi:hypothetical protein
MLPGGLYLVVWGALVIHGLLLLAVAALPRPIYQRWSVKVFAFRGMSARQFLGLVVCNGVDPVFYHRAVYATYLSIVNSLFWDPYEEKRFPRADIEKTEIRHPPIFILGHYRSGPRGRSHMHADARTHTYTYTQTHRSSCVGT